MESFFRCPQAPIMSHSIQSLLPSDFTPPRMRGETATLQIPTDLARLFDGFLMLTRLFCHLNHRNIFEFNLYKEILIGSRQTCETQNTIAWKRSTRITAPFWCHSKCGWNETRITRTLGFWNLPASVCVGSASLCCACVSLFWVLRFPPTVRRH